MHHGVRFNWKDVLMATFQVTGFVLLSTYVHARQCTTLMSGQPLKDSWRSLHLLKYRIFLYYSNVGSAIEGLLEIIASIEVQDILVLL